MIIVVPCKGGLWGGKKKSGEGADHTHCRYSRPGESALIFQRPGQVITCTVGSILQGLGRQVGIALSDLAVGVPQYLLDFVERPT